MKQFVKAGLRICALLAWVSSYLTLIIKCPKFDSYLLKMYNNINVSYYFQSEGYHNFYKVEEMAQTNCDQVVPLFGLYDNNGYQIGFGFSATGADKGNYFEYPPSGAVEVFLTPLSLHKLIRVLIPILFIQTGDRWRGSPSMLVGQC